MPFILSKFCLLVDVMGVGKGGEGRGVMGVGKGGEGRGRRR